MARKALDRDAAEYKSRLIAERVQSLECFMRAKTVMCYVDFGSEVRTRGILKNILSLGKILAVPLVVEYGLNISKMIASQVLDLELDLEKGHFGIMEPRKEAVREIPPQNLDMVIVPGAAFDLHGHRMGYGAGFYDRYLADIRSDCKKAGICFDMQLYDSIPCEKCDALMDIIITESRIIIDNQI